MVNRGCEGKRFLPRVLSGFRWPAPALRHEIEHVEERNAFEFGIRPMVEMNLERSAVCWKLTRSSYWCHTVVAQLAADCAEWEMSFKLSITD